MKLTKIIIGILCATVLSTCYFYGVHKGLNSRITVGFELDAASISIALSRLWYRLYEGYVGYRDVYNALFHVLVPDSNPNNPLNFHLLSEPQAIQQGFDYVKSLVPAHPPRFHFFPHNILSADFISVNMEDHGLADFYTLAFLLFGVQPTAMYSLYFLLMGFSVVLFISEYRHQLFPMILIGLMVSTFSIFFFSSLFNTPMLPSVNSNRFMSTLGFIPIAHALCIYFKPLQTLNRIQLYRLLAQALLFAFALSIRSSAQWQLIALIVFTLMIAMPVYWPYRKRFFELDRLRQLKHPVLMATLVFTMIVSGYQAIQGMMLNPVYHTDCSPPYHGIWHSAYLGLAVHPDWMKLNMQNPITASIDDGNSWRMFEKYMKERGLDPVCHITGGVYAGLAGTSHASGMVSFYR